MPILIILFILLDQFSKHLLNTLLVLQRPVPVIKGFFYLTLVHNTGAAFGIFKNRFPVFMVVSAVAIVLIVMQLAKHGRFPKPSLRVTALSLILAGAAGNLIDRILLGYVIDFLDFRFWPVFNIADSCITIGAILLGWSLFRQERNEQRPIAH